MSDEKPWPPEIVIVPDMPPDRAMLVVRRAFEPGSVELVISGRRFTSGLLDELIAIHRHEIPLVDQAVLIENLKVEGTIDFDPTQFKSFIDTLDPRPLRLPLWSLRAAKYRARLLMRKTQRQRLEHVAVLMEEGWSARAAKAEARAFIPRITRSET